MSTSKKAATKKAATKKKAAPPAPPAEERFIVLLRHGIAEERTPDKKDEDRGLTSEGHARMKEIARGLERAFPKAQVIYSSPLLRAVQTALWVSKGYKSRVNIKTTDALAPGTTPKQFLELIKSIPERRVILVGHEPTLSADMTALVGIESAKFELKKGGCYGVRIAPDGTATLEWLLAPRVLRKLG
ncbi:MAG: SixA phosphatase family protein [Thermoanaerobaculia bacterium]